MVVMGEKMYHIDLEMGQGAEYAILPGDPDRVEFIARYLETPKKLASKREFTTFEGYIGETRVLVTSTGIGGPSAAIAIEELCKIGVRTFIRVGTCGGMQPFVNAGDLVLPIGAVRAEGTTREYAPVEFPAVADFDVLCALKRAAEKEQITHQVGVVHSKDSFYGQHDPDSMPIGWEMKERWRAFIRLGVLASEMECAALFSVCAARKARAGAVLTAVWNQEREDGGGDFEVSHDKAIRCAVEAVKILASGEHEG